MSMLHLSVLGSVLLGQRTKLYLQEGPCQDQSDGCLQF